MQKSFLFNAFFVLLINVLIKPLYLFGIDRNVQILTGEDYGRFYTFFSIAFILNFVSDLGIQNFNLRFSSQSEQTIPKNFQKFLALKLVLAVVYFLGYWCIGWITGYGLEHTGLFLLVGLSLWLNSFLLFVRSFIAARGYYLFDSILSVVDKTVMILILGAVILHPMWRTTLSIELFVQIQILAYALATLMGLIVLLRINSKLWPKWEPKFFMVIIKQALPYALVFLLMSVYARIDSVMLAFFHPQKMAAVDAYAESYRILEALNLFGFLLSGLLLPMFSKFYKSKNSPDDLFYKGLGISAALAIPVALATYSYAPLIMQSLYHHDGGGKILQWHIFVFAVNTISYLFGTLITAAGRIAQLNIFFLAACVLNIGLNWIVIPMAGAEGAAMTSLVTQAFVFLGQAFYAYHKLGLKFLSNPWLRIGLFIAVIFALTIAVLQLGVNWFWSFLLLILVGGILSIVMRVLDVRSSIILLRSKINP